MRDDNFWSRATPGDPWRGRRSSSRRWNFGCSPSLPTPPTSLSVTARDGSYKKKGSLHPYARLSLASGGILIEPVYWRAYRRLEPRCQTILILQVCPTSSDRETFTPMTSSCSRASRNLSPPPTPHRPHNPAVLEPTSNKFQTRLRRTINQRDTSDNSTGGKINRRHDSCSW